MRSGMQEALYIIINIGRWNLVGADNRDGVYGIARQIRRPADTVGRKRQEDDDHARNDQSRPAAPSTHRGDARRSLRLQTRRLPLRYESEFFFRRWSLLHSLAQVNYVFR